MSGLRDHPLVRRAPFLVMVAVGFWLWKSPLFPQERQLTWHTGEDRASIRSVEIQLWTEQGELLKRAELFFPQGPGPEIAEKVPLREGQYLARVFVRREGRAATTHSAERLSITRDESYALRLP